MEYIEIKFSFLIATLYSMSSVQQNIDFCSLQNLNKKKSSQCNFIFYGSFQQRKLCGRSNLPSSRRKESNGYFCCFFNIKYESPLLKERNLFREETIGLGPKSPYYLGRKKKQCLNLYCERPFGAHPVRFYLFLCLETQWPPSHSMLDYEG